MKSDKNRRPDIRIGTLVREDMDSAEYIRQILPYGFESFSLVFFRNTEKIDFRRLSDEVNEVLDGSGAVISSLCVYGNPMEKKAENQKTLRGLRKCIDNAHLFGCDVVGGFTGRLSGRRIDECIGRFRQIWKPLAERAVERNVRIAFENCSMGGSWATGDWNIAHNPVAWDMMFDAVPCENLGLQWEPCHQMVSLMDPMPQIGEWGKRIFHVHGKDANIHWDVVQKYGVYSAVPVEVKLPGSVKAVPPFACHRTPGFGDSDWTEIISELRRVGFQGSIDIEGWHDPVMRDELEMTGQVHALQYLKACRGDYVPNPLA